MIFLSFLSLLVHLQKVAFLFTGNTHRRMPRLAVDASTGHGVPGSIQGQGHFLCFIFIYCVLWFISLLILGSIKISTTYFSI